MSMLDRPVWSSLTTAHLAIGEGGALARRYQTDVNHWASARDDSPEAVARLAALVEPDGTIYTAQSTPLPPLPDMRVVKDALGVQMLDTGADLPNGGRGDIAKLGDADAADMLALATLTDPGPFLARTHVMGDYFGVRAEGRLIAMAGERMRFPGYTEVSAVCTHPDFRGRGYGTRLMAHVMRAIRARGETPFLHAWKTNESAIRLYESIGFKHRRDLHVTVLRKAR